MRRPLWISAVGLLAACAESVAPRPYFIAMFPGADTLLVGSTRQFTATVYDYASKPLDLPVVWSSSDPAIAAIDSLGVVRAIGEGHARITAAAGTIVGSAGLSVTALRADRVWDFTQVLFGPQQVVCSDTGSFQFGPAHPTSISGQGQRVGACTSDVRSNISVVGDSVTAGDIVGDSITFRFTTCTYRAHAIGVPLDSLDGTVWCPTGYTGTWQAGHDRPIASVIVRPDTAGLLVGLTLQLDAVIADAAARRLFWRPITWSSNAPGVANVSADGVVGTIAAGPATITATVAQQNGSAEISVMVIDFKSVASGAMHTCGLDLSGNAYCWGHNSNGQLGDGSTQESTRPVRVATTVVFDTLVTGDWYSCGLSAGQAWCWGPNFDGQLGDGTTTQRLTPVRVSGGHSFVTITAAYAHTCALAADQQAYCWGRNDRGQLGDSSRTARTVPTVVSGGFQFRELSAANLHTCGLTTGGDLHCWGNNAEGEFGNGTHADSDVPVPAGDTLRFLDVTPGDSYTCGLTDQGVAYCWGNNFSGALGIGTRDDGWWTTPQPVTGGWTFQRLNAGGAHTCGVTTEGAALCWGYNARGSVGDSTTAQYRTVPTVVVGNHSFTVVGGGGPTCGTDTQGIIWCWGGNDFGQVGDGGTADRRYPVKVVGQP